MKLVNEQRRCCFSPRMLNSDCLSSNRKLFLRGVLKNLFCLQMENFCVSYLWISLPRQYQPFHLYPSVSLLQKSIVWILVFSVVFVRGIFWVFFARGTTVNLKLVTADTRTVILHFIMNNKINDKNNISSQIGRKFFKSLESLKSFQSVTRNQPWKALMLVDSLFGKIVSFWKLEMFLKGLLEFLLKSEEKCCHRKVREYN